MNSFKGFRSPPQEFSACAFWFWNGELSPERMVWQMDEMREKGIFSAFMHARAYLQTPYLEEEWFRVMDACVNRARETGFTPWLYDEYAWPSGTCGSTFEHGLQAPSRVLAKGRENMAKGIYPEVYTGELDFSRREIACNYPLHGDRTAFYERVYENAVDYLNPSAIRDFLDCTHEVYKARYGKDFGTTIPGIFFDEIYLAGRPLPWTDNLPEAFQEIFHYDLLTFLYMLIQDGEVLAPFIRTEYYAALAAMYEKAFFKQIADWCTENRLQLTGHTEEDLLHHPRRQGDYFRTMRNLHIPGADCHDYRYRFPREISMHEPKYAVSVARLYGKPRAMSEAMGGAGWGCTLQEYKRGINALGAAGINMFVLHGFYNDCEHQGSQGDWPASFFYQNPYWKYFKRFSEYIHRVSYMNTLGEAVVDVGLYYPIEEMAAHTVAGEPDETAREIDKGFHAALRAFLETQIDVDIIDRNSLLAAEVKTGRLHAGTQKFRVLVFPSNLRKTEEITETLKKFRKQGGMVLVYPAGLEELQEGISASDLCEPDAMPARYRTRFTPFAACMDGIPEKLYCSCRVIGRKYMYMIASTLNQPRRLRLKLRGQGAVRKLNLEDGTDAPLVYGTDKDCVRTIVELEADEACWIVTGCQPDLSPPKTTVAETVALDGEWTFLPLNKRYDDLWAIDAEETVLSVPLAHFEDQETGHESDIRIRNMADEPGYCGRHVSLWKACWLGRRVGWGDDADKADLYFTKSFTLEATVLSAQVCIAAVTSFTLYINGREAAHVDDAFTPQTLDVGEFLHTGLNRIAVHVHTDTPLQSRELTQAEIIPSDVLASLLLQGEIETEAGTVELLSDASWTVSARFLPGWATAEPQTVRTIDPKQVLCHVAPGLTDANWVWAWERGKPPMLPWGDLPLFGEQPEYPRLVRYTVTLPAGAVRVDMPDISGGCIITLDDQFVSIANGVIHLSADGRTHQLQFDVEAPNPDGGLRGNVSVHIVPQAVTAGDWRTRGLAWFSGRALYKKTVEIQKDPGRRYVLDLGRVCFYAEIWVNGSLCDTRVWEPYKTDITKALKDGRNEIAVVVANSAACERRHMLVDEGMALAWNRYWNEDNIDREPENLVSGLLGPVKLEVIDPQ